YSESRKTLAAEENDAPEGLGYDEQISTDWAATAHAAASVNCSGCHTSEELEWTNHPTHESCGACHDSQVAGFLEGRHGMRLAQGLSPMTPSAARLPMYATNGHAELTCSACHTPHKYDTAYAAVDACVKCHADEHSTAYLDSPHYDLWQSELAGEGKPGSGVSCATCHLPRLKNAEKETFVQHNQNDNLRPNEKMVESICHQCHGLQFSLDALADEVLIKNNFQGEPEVHVESLDMAKHWFDERARLREEAKQKREGG
ncbi:MAG: ammonia-forming cytochrome c nitrite reductase subunit c552, partial [Lacipirellulaceae bacterium]